MPPASSRVAVHDLLLPRRHIERTGGRSLRLVLLEWTDARAITSHSMKQRLPMRVLSRKIGRWPFIR
jgi:hypothetical protein